MFSHPLLAVASWTILLILVIFFYIFLIKSLFLSNNALSSVRKVVK